jgi:hypothetical protein
MKRVFSVLFIFSLGACTTEIIERSERRPPTAANELQTVSLNARLSQSATTYSSAYGGATNVDASLYELRYIVEAWTREATPRLAARQYRIVESNFTTTSASFSLQLAPARLYDLLVWADFVAQGTTESAAATADNYYQTNDGHEAWEIVDDPTCDRGLRHVVLKSSNTYNVNNDARDAYCSVSTLDLSTVTQEEGFSSSLSLTLTRPFGKLRTLGFYDESNLTQITKWQMKYDVATLPAAYDVAGDSVIPSETVAVGSWYPVRDVDYEDITIASTTYHSCLLMACDYLFPTTGLALTLRGYDATNTLVGEQSFTDAAIRRNRITNIVGSIFFVSVDGINISISDELH